MAFFFFFNSKSDQPENTLRKQEGSAENTSSAFHDPLPRPGCKAKLSLGLAECPGMRALVFGSWISRPKAKLSTVYCGSLGKVYVKKSTANSNVPNCAIRWTIAKFIALLEESNDLLPYKCWKHRTETKKCPHSQNVRSLSCSLRHVEMWHPLEVSERQQKLVERRIFLV